MSRYIPDSPKDRSRSVKTKKRRMDPFYILMIILMAVVAALTVSTVAFLISSGRHALLTSSQNASSELSSSESETSADPSSLQPESQNETSSNAGSSSESNPDFDDPSSGTASLAADAAFAENSIDQKKEAALMNADSTTEILQVYDTTLTEWKNAVQKMYMLLKDSQVDLTSEQNVWMTETAKSIAAKETELNEGGSAKQIEVAEYKCQLYRDRAQVLFARILKLNPNYRF